MGWTSSFSSATEGRFKAPVKPSWQNLVQDVTSMSAFSLSAADELVRRVVEEAEAKKVPARGDDG